MYNRVWDEADYVVPPAENGAFFVATNVVITPNQTRGELKLNITFHRSNTNSLLYVTNTCSDNHGNVKFEC